jgi:hypothetical protein
MALLNRSPQLFGRLGHEADLESAVVDARVARSSDGSELQFVSAVSSHPGNFRFRISDFGFRTARRVIRAIASICFAVIFMFSPRGAIGQVFKEYDLKALFLYNFAQFVQWPPEAFPSADTPLIIGVLGQDRFGKSLDDLIRNETAGVGRRKLRIERYHRLADVQNCHILFIDQSEAANVDEIVRKYRGKPTLTVSDMEGFTRHGGMIQFITDEKEKKIRLRINVGIAKAENLMISSKLLKLAQIE